MATWGDIQYWAVPAISPVAVALVTGTSAHAALMAVPNVPPGMAIAGAVAFGAAVELSGGLAFTAFSRAVSVKSFWAATAAAGLIAAYTATIAIAANIGAHAGILSATAIIPFLAYGSAAVVDYTNRMAAAQANSAREKNNLSARDANAKNAAAEIEKMRIQAEIIASNNAASIARANARVVNPRSVLPVPRNRQNRQNGQNGQNGQNRQNGQNGQNGGGLSAERLDAAREAYAKNQKITAREMAAAVKSTSSSVGARYLAAVSAK